MAAHHGVLDRHISETDSRYRWHTINPSEEQCQVIGKHDYTTKNLLALCPLFNFEKVAISIFSFSIGKNYIRLKVYYNCFVKIVSSSIDYLNLFHKNKTFSCFKSSYNIFLPYYSSSLILVS